MDGLGERGDGGDGGEEEVSGGREARLQPIQERLGDSAAGRQILSGIDSNNDGTISRQELALAWSSLNHLATKPGAPRRPPGCARVCRGWQLRGVSVCRGWR